MIAHAHAGGGDWAHPHSGLEREGARARAADRARQPERGRAADRRPVLGEQGGDGGAHPHGHDAQGGQAGAARLPGDFQERQPDERARSGETSHAESQPR